MDPVTHPGLAEEPEEKHQCESEKKKHRYREDNGDLPVRQIGEEAQRANTRRSANRPVPDPPEKGGLLLSLIHI